MTSQNFAFWLQGFFEISDAQSLTVDQTDMVKRHLAMVFKHEIDPAFGKDLKALRKLHRKKEIVYCGNPFKKQKAAKKKIPRERERLFSQSDDLITC